jgi:hypothetical protein
LAVFMLIKEAFIDLLLLSFINFSCAFRFIDKLNVKKIDIINLFILTEITISKN